MPNQNVPNLKESPENDPIDFDDSLIGLHMQAGLVDKSWILFDSGACANCCPEWFAPDYPTLPLNESAPLLRSLSGKTLDVPGRKIVQLDCGNGHSLSVQFYVCTGIPFPLVSVARLLLQDFWTVMAKDYMALIDPTGNPVPIVRQGTLVYLTPTVIPYGVANAARLAATCLPEVMSGIEEELGALELRGVSDVHDCSIDHLCQIGALIASAQGMRSSEGGRQDTWEVHETELKLIRHVKVWRNEMLDPRIKLANRMPVPVLRLTGERLTHKVYRDGSTVTVRDANFLTMTNTRPRDEKDWRGRVEFGLTHKPQRRHVRKSVPRPHDPVVGKPPPSANADIAEMEHKSETAPRVRARTGEEPEELERKMRVSRNVEEHELENALRSLSDQLWGDRYTMFFDSSDPTMIDTGHQNEWADIELPDGSVKKCENPRGPTGHRWTGYTLFVPLDRPTAGENAEQETEDRSAVKPKMLKVPGEPSESERRLHEFTHLPYRDWCEHCVKSKGRQSHAVKKKSDRQPVIQIDFSFMATENDLPKRTILNATDVQTGSMAVVLPSKGSVEKYAVAELRKFVFEIGRTFGIVQYDKEAPLKTMARDLCKVVGGMSMRSAPTGHS